MIDHGTEAVPTFGSNYRKAEPGIPGRGFDDMPAISQQPPLFGIEHHCARHPDLRGARRVELLELE
jgi:hypothetical protein